MKHSIIIFLLSHIIFSIELLAHDGPHDDFPVPDYFQSQQDGYAQLTVSKNGQDIIATLIAPIQIITGHELFQGKNKAKEEAGIKSLLAELSKIMVVDNQKECKPGFKSINLQHKHRLLKDLPKDKIKNTEKDKLIKPFEEILASYKLSCDKKSKFVGLDINLFDNAKFLKHLEVVIQDGKNSKSIVMMPNRMLFFGND